MPRGPYSGAGNFGGIPDHVILQKQERTNIAEDPSMLDYYQRQLLKDTRPDAPFMASDIPSRGGFDPRTGEMRQGASDSRARLAHRYSGDGHRSWSTPWLPDGTFLDYQGLEKDPRSIRPDPDFREMAKQEYFRGRYIPYSPDNDDSVPETGMNTYRRWESIRQSQQWSADRMKWFDTAKDNRTSRRAGQTIPNEHRAVQTTVDGEVINLADALTANKSNITDVLTNQYKIGWRRTTDQTFNVAKYGQIRPTMNMADQAWYKSLRQGEEDRPEQGIFQDQRVPRQLIKVMENIVRGRAIKQDLTDGIPWRSAYGLKNYKENAIAANYRGGTVGYQSIEDRAKEIVRVLQDAYIQRKDAMLAAPSQPNSHIGMSWIDPNIIYFLELNNRKIGPMDTKMILKDAAKLSKTLGYDISNKEMGVYVPAAPGDFKPIKQLWDSNNTQYTNESLVLPDYVNIAPTTPQPLQKLMSGENYKSSGANALMFSNQPPPDKPRTLVGGYLAMDQDFSSENGRPQTIGVMGSKYTRRFTTPTHDELPNDNLRDTESKNYTAAKKNGGPL